MSTGFTAGVYIPSARFPFRNFHISIAGPHRYARSMSARGNYIAPYCMKQTATNRQTEAAIRFAQMLACVRRLCLGGQAWG